MNGKKKLKYNNGGLVAQKQFGNVGSLVAQASGDQGFRSGSVTGNLRKGSAAVSATKFKDSAGFKSGSMTGSLRKGSAVVSASKYKDSAGGRNKNISIEKQLKNKSSVGANKSAYGMGASYNKQLKSGFNLRVEARKDGRGQLSGSMSISKPL
jgi:hypothetical protein